MNNNLLMIIISVSLTLTSGLSFAEEGFVTDQLFFVEALQYYSETIDPKSVKLEPVKNIKNTDKEDSLRLSNFKAKVNYHNQTNVKGDIHNVRFSTFEGKEASCFGTIFPISHALMEIEEAAEYKARSGTVYLSECIIHSEKENIPFDSNFEIKHYQIFPLISDLPLTNTDSLGAYQLYKKVPKSKKLFACVDSDLNAFDQPRSAFEIFDIGDHYSIGSVIASSSPNFDEPDIPMDLGPQDIHSLTWFKDNLEFIMNLKNGPDGAYAVAFPKEDCLLTGSEDNVLHLACVLDMEPSERNKNIKRVSFNMSQSLRSQILPKVGKNDHILLNSVEYVMEAEFVVDKPNPYNPVFKQTVYKSRVVYENKAGINECAHSPRPKPEAVEQQGQAI